MNFKYFYFKWREDIGIPEILWACDGPNTTFRLYSFYVLNKLNDDAFG